MSKHAGALFLLIFLELFVPRAGAAKEIARKFDVDTAYRLVAEAYGPMMKPADFDHQGTMDDAPFLAFAGLSPPPGEGFFGFFDVNPWTGDVWSVWRCKWLSTPQLRKSQAAIKRKFSRDELRQYPRLHRLQPECDYP